MLQCRLFRLEVVDKYHWLSMTEFGDLVTIAEMTPGPIAVNSATFVGTQVAGIPGALVATLGCILPSCIIVTLLARIYIKYRNVSIMQDILGTLRSGCCIYDRSCRTWNSCFRIFCIRTTSYRNFPTLIYAASSSLQSH